MNRVLPALLMALLLAACGGSDDTPATPLPPPAAPLTTLSQSSPFAAGCGGTRGVVHGNAEVEPHAAINPLNPANRIAVWQQDRWDNGGALGLVAATTLDGGESWSLQALPVSRCAGGSDYERATDPWVTFGPDGVAYVASLSFTGAARGTGSSSAILALRSADGGLTWSPPQAVIAEGSDVFNDKEAITADPLNAGFAYVVWDRLVSDFQAMTYFARTIDGGLTWEPAREIFNPGTRSQTIGNQVVVLPDGALLNVFQQINTESNNQLSSLIRAMRSTDRGVTWGAPVTIADQFTVGTRDPQTGAFVRDGGGMPAIAVAPDGDLFVAWQDARFSTSEPRDGIAVSRSIDGGVSWSTPVQVNGELDAAAFTPFLRVLADGRIGVSYTDLRADTADRNSLLAAFWLTTSTDGQTWREVLVAGPFDLDHAPNSNGLFVGDYTGLIGVDDVFVPVFATTNADAANRTDIRTAVIEPSAFSASTGMVAAAKAKPVSGELRQRVDENLRRLTEPVRVPRTSSRRGHESRR